ncbi:hypothetical protein EJ110_NYTH47899 [Nymphaea thermarum]|nr:hypothetical protein EJ110_NYTH47899 [Nymphaea thermarum]
MKYGNMNLAPPVSRNTMITRHGTHGHCFKAFELFDEMIKDGASPDDTTFLSLISACSHGALVHEGSNNFTRMSREF